VELETTARQSRQLTDRLQCTTINPDNTVVSLAATDSETTHTRISKIRNGRFAKRNASGRVTLRRSTDGRTLLLLLRGKRLTPKNLRSQAVIFFETRTNAFDLRDPAGLARRGASRRRSREPTTDGASPRHQAAPRPTGTGSGLSKTGTSGPGKAVASRPVALKSARSPRDCREPSCQREFHTQNACRNIKRGARLSEAATATKAQDKPARSNRWRASRFGCQITSATAVSRGLGRRERLRPAMLPRFVKPWVAAPI
jgi:hypothetical protein